MTNDDLSRLGNDQLKAVLIHSLDQLNSLLVRQRELAAVANPDPSEAGFLAGDSAWQRWKDLERPREEYADRCSGLLDYLTDPGQSDGFDLFDCVPPCEGAIPLLLYSLLTNTPRSKCEPEEIAQFWSDAIGALAIPRLDDPAFARGLLRGVLDTQAFEMEEEEKERQTASGDRPE